MKIICNEKVFEKFPEASFHGAIFEKVDLVGEEIANIWRRRAVEDVRTRAIKPELLVEDFAIKEWRDAYRLFGLKPSKFRSSIEQLYKRALKGDFLRTHFPLVNLYCYISIVNMIPMGGYDLDRIKDQIEIRPTKSGEKFQGIGEREPIESQPDVISYSDAEGILCWAWNHRDSLRTCLNDRTQSAIFFADSATGATRKMAERAIQDLAKTLVEIGCRKAAEFVLDRNTGSFGVVDGSLANSTPNNSPN
jgi:DNA/RNA-binding domain of Phe-tRNA-synthetase-like protein